MHPSHIAANGVEQQSVTTPTPTPTHHRHSSSSIAHMPLVFAVLVVWAIPVTCFLLLPLFPTLHYEAFLSGVGGRGC